MTLTIPGIERLLAEWAPSPGDRAASSRASRWAHAPDLARLALDQARELAAQDADIAQGQLDYCALMEKHDALFVELAAANARIAELEGSLRVKLLKPPAN